MEYINVKSSKLIKIGYDKQTEEMEVYFKNEHIYLFTSVPQNFYIDCLLADSIGKYFYDNIKNSFPYTIIK